jgi:DNA polymerase-3 subunit alpha
VRFIHKEDYEAHEARVCIHEGYVLADPKRPRIYSEQQYFRSPQEMQELFKDIPESLQNTVEIAKRCNVTLTLGKNFLPRFPVPDGYTVETYLNEVAKTGLEERLRVSHDTQAETFTTIRKPY